MDRVPNIVSFDDSIGVVNSERTIPNFELFAVRNVAFIKYMIDKKGKIGREKPVRISSAIITRVSI